MSAKLQTLQREMQRAIMTGLDDAPFVQSFDQQERAARLRIYSSAYRLRLREALASNFSVLEAHVGTPAFATLANCYLETRPSTHFSVRAFGDSFPAWLGSERPNEPWLAELASLEWSLGCAFDAPDEPTLTSDALAALQPEQWTLLRFRFAASARRLRLMTNAAELYSRAAADELDARGRCESRPADWLVWRKSLTVHYRSIDRIEVTAFDALANGATFALACERLLDIADDRQVPSKAAALLKRWIADELIVTFSIAQA